MCPGPRVEWVRSALADARARGVSCARRWSVWAPRRGERGRTLRRAYRCARGAAVRVRRASYVFARPGRGAEAIGPSHRGGGGRARAISLAQGPRLFSSYSRPAPTEAYRTLHARGGDARALSLCVSSAAACVRRLTAAGRTSTEVSALGTCTIIHIGAGAAVGVSAGDVCPGHASVRRCATGVSGIRWGLVSRMHRGLGRGPVHLYAACRMDGELVESTLSLEMYEDVCDGVGMQSSTPGAVRHEHLGRARGEDAFGRLGACRRAALLWMISTVGGWRTYAGDTSCPFPRSVRSIRAAALFLSGHGVLPFLYPPRSPLPLKLLPAPRSPLPLLPALFPFFRLLCSLYFLPIKLFTNPFLHNVGAHSNTIPNQLVLQAKHEYKAEAVHRIQSSSELDMRASGSELCIALEEAITAVGHLERVR
ncbi:hypothetical protein B0H16DRAFT_1837501 [Mycena metata]|uniref:Uncharacterized protein n=1 Tax=Mycena metata TaxID=1033252 RepID=A0AAD7IX97_9AGAR|nr:hypothetical protein B0H16DRAFT_1837501 [Mycena metata]